MAGKVTICTESHWLWVTDFSGFIHLWAEGLGHGDEYPAYTPG